MFVSLKQWIEGIQRRPMADGVGFREMGLNTTQILNTTRMAFGLLHLLKETYQNNLVTSSQDLEMLCNLDNFLACLSSPNDPDQDVRHEDIIGVDMISPRVSLRFIETYSSNQAFHGHNSSFTGGRCLEVEVQVEANNQAGIIPSEIDEKDCCHFLGLLLYELFSHNFPPPAADLQQMSTAELPGTSEDGPTRKKSTAQFKIKEASPTSLFELGFPSSINMIVEDLIGRGLSGNRSESAYHTLHVACNDLLLAILEPDRFLFDRQISSYQPLNRSVALHFRRDKIFGREEEIAKILSAFNRVFAGKSEAVIIGGYSGCGKTRLVKSLTEKIKSVSCFVVMQKLDLMESEPYSAVIATFNELCLKIIAQTCPTKRLPFITKLMDEFSSDFFLLGQLLPNIYTLCPQLKTTSDEVHTSPQMNLNSVSFILQKFVRIVSETLQPVMLFLDDLQWADSASLELLLSILSDEKSSRFFFVGSYRDNAVDPDHAIFDMVKKLDKCGVPTSRLLLKGLHRSDLNSMISNSLCMFPRYCAPLSAIVFIKTKGNPLFTEQYLQSLVDRKLLQYSLREKRWNWEMNQVISESMTKSDVLSLLTSKIGGLADGMQSALKAMSCFGNKVNKIVARRLSSTPQYRGLLQNLDESVKEGLVENNGQEFKFAHDSIREAVYNLIPINERDQFHFNLALLLFSECQGDDLDNMSFFVCDQFKKARQILEKDDAVTTNIVCLFIKAGKKAIEQSEYPRARSYFGIAEEFLPTNFWSSYYDQCLRFYYLRAKSSHSCGHVEEARNALRQILTKGQCFEDKLNAYYLLASIHLDSNESESAYSIGCSVLSQIHEQVPDSIDDHEQARLIEETSNLLSSTSDDELLQMKEADKKFHATLKFYSLMCTITFIMKPHLVPYFVCKLIQLTVQNGCSEYSIIGFSGFAAIHCFVTRLKNIEMAKRIGKCALSFQKRFNFKYQIPILFAGYYGFVGPFCEPLQSCADMHRQGFEHGLSIGDSSSAFTNPHFILRAGLFSGEKLSKLQEETNYYQKLACKFGHSHSKDLVEQYRVTFSSLIGGEMSDSNCYRESLPGKVNHHFHLAVQSFWLRQQEKFEESCREITGAPVQNLFNSYLILFYHGLNFFQHQREKNLEKKIFNAKRYVQEMKLLVEQCRWNFHNKMCLLEAEVLSASEKHDDAKVSYAAAIESSRESKFIHEEGLSCELAGFHCIRIGEYNAALAHFGRAKECYTKWGSELKVKFIEGAIEEANSKIRGEWNAVHR